MNKKIKRLLALGLCVCMLGTTACGSGSDDTNKDDEGKKEIVLSEQSIKRDYDYGDVNEPRKFEGSEVFESDVFVAPIEGMSDDFIRGVDVSSYISQKDSGAKYYDFEGNELDDAGFFNFLADCGVNWIRIRVWNDPYNKEGMGYGGGNNDVDKAIVMGKLATNAGMRVFIDFHYSDFWADPAKQSVPKAWDHKSLDDKVKLTKEFTTESLNRLIDAGVDVGMVQVGNETNNGVAGETEEARIFTILKAGAEAVRAVSKDITVAVHFTNPQNAGFSDYVGKLIDAGVDFDVFGISYYPFWHGTLEKLKKTMTTIIETYDKKVMVAETSYFYTGTDGDGHSNSVNPDTEGIDIPYEASIQGQTNEVRDVMAAVASVGEMGVGMFYWEPAWTPVQNYAASESKATLLEENKALWEENGSGWASSYASDYDPDDAGVYFGGSAWDNQAQFDFDGKPLESLNVYKYVFSGTTAENKISSVPDMDFVSGLGSAVEMPETIDALMISGAFEPLPVVWDDAQVKAAEAAGEAGVYTINGVATAEDGTTYDVVCNLELKKWNYIQDESFENGEFTNWVGEGVGFDLEDGTNAKTGSFSLHFYAEEAYEFTVTQTIKDIPAGTYELTGNLQGGSGGSKDIYEMFVLVNGVEQKVSMKLKGWQNWDTQAISNIEVPEGAEVIVGVRVNAIAKAWGAFDDFTLYSMD